MINRILCMLLGHSMAFLDSGDIGTGEIDHVTRLCLRCDKVQRLRNFVWVSRKKR